MFILSGRRPLWLMLIAVGIFSATLIGRLTFGQVSLSAAEPKEAAPISRNTADTIADMQDRLRLNPEDTQAYARLGLALLQRVRETGDAALYTQADKALSEALQRDPKQFEAVIGQGLLTLARHEFKTALTWGEKARQINPYNIQGYGIIFDAEIELGRYEAAEATIQKMLATRPELSVYSRLSYLRELQGDRAGAINAMQQAVDSGLATAEGTLWSRVQLGHLYFNQGDLAQAEKVYLQTLTFNPDYIYAFAGLARVRAGQGKHDEAIEYYETIVETLPLPEFVIALADLYEVTGQPAKAKQQIGLVQAIQQLSSQAGLNVDLELALFNADHGIEPAQTLRQARAAYAERPGIYGADTLAWALYQNGEYEEALVYSQDALRLNTQDALLHFHAGLINRALGRTAAAQTHLAQALQINPHFSIRYAPQAQTLLLELQPSDE